MFDDIFEKYKDPEKAKRVWGVYQVDVELKKVRETAKEIALSCRDSASLDALLYQLTKIEKRSSSSRQRIPPTGYDGSWDNGIRSYEDNPVGREYPEELDDFE